MTEAACATDDHGVYWVPDRPKDEAEVLELAEPVCGSCPAHGSCYAYALGDKTLVGIWASTTTAMRKRAKAAQRAA